MDTLGNYPRILRSYFQTGNIRRTNQSPSRHTVKRVDSVLSAYSDRQRNCGVVTRSLGHSNMLIVTYLTAREKPTAHA